MCGSVWAGGQCIWRDNSAGVEFGTFVRVVRYGFRYYVCGRAVSLAVYLVHVLHKSRAGGEVTINIFQLHCPEWPHTSCVQRPTSSERLYSYRVLRRISMTRPNCVC